MSALASSLVLLTAGVLQAVIASPALDSRALVASGGTTLWELPNSRTVVSQCSSLKFSIYTQAPPKEHMVWYAVNNWPYYAADWQWDEGDPIWKDGNTPIEFTWDAVDVAEGTLLWMQLDTWDNQMTKLVGDGITVQASDDKKCLTINGNQIDKEQGDKSYQSMSGQPITTTIVHTSSHPSATASKAIHTASSSVPHSSSSTSSSSSASANALPAGQGQQDATKSSVVGPAVGGAVGGVAFLLGAGLGVWFWRKNRRDRLQPGDRFVFGIDEDLPGGMAESVDTASVAPPVPWTYHHPSVPAPEAHTSDPTPLLPQHEVDAGPAPATESRFREWLPPAYGTQSASSHSHSDPVSSTAPPPSVSALKDALRTQNVE